MGGAQCEYELRDGQRVFILKRDSSQTSLKAKFSFYLKKLIPFVEFASDCSVKWTEGILRIHCEVDDLLSASFASPAVGFPRSSKLPMLLSPDPLQEGCRKWMEIERQCSTQALTFRTGKWSVSWMWCCLYLGSLHTGARFHSREIIEKRKKDHLLSTFSILGALVCMLTYFL